jgi:hypothetical protein
MIFIIVEILYRGTHTLGFHQKKNQNRSKRR